MCPGVFHARRVRLVRIATGLMLVLGGWGCLDSKPGGALGSDPSFDALVSGYHQLERFSERPIEFQDFGLCRLPVPGLDTPLHQQIGQIHVYGNALAAAPMAEPGERSFPAGSVIVKEKLREGEVVGLGMMVRREPEPDGWAFGYFEDGQLFEDVDQLEQCWQCHSTGELPEDLSAELLGVDDLQATGGYTSLFPTPRDGVFLTLPE